MKITTTNDGKGKYQSYRASIDFDGYTPMSSLTFGAVGYGDTEKEAIENLKIQVQEMIKLLPQELL